MNQLSSVVIIFLFGIFQIQYASAGQKEKIMMMKKMAPAKGYIEAHKNAEPNDLFGGAIHTKISQTDGGVFVILPSPRKLDPRVFGTPKMPRAFAGTPGINGVPLMIRGTKGGKYSTTKIATPFGDKYIVMNNGKLKLDAVDRTAQDAKSTHDTVKMMASWKDKTGNTYSVKCCKKLAAHGMEFPTFGGVVHNVILHGFTRIGTALMPSEYTYFAFWGMGSIFKNNKLLEKPRLIHGMLTEYVRTKGYKLAFDHQVNPGGKQFHLMVAPMMPDMKHGTFKHKAVNTGFKLKNGMTLPFWHVMFENLKIDSKHL